MPKDENAVSYIDEFNRSHRRIKREEKDWYVMYLPRGLGMEDITEKEDRELMAIFTTAEEEMEMEFDLLVRDRFEGYFESLAMVDVLEFLPQKPTPILLENMKREDRDAIRDIYTEAIESGYIKKTIRKQIRKYLDDHGYLKMNEVEEIEEPESETKKSRKMAEKRYLKKKEMELADIEEFLPQKPHEIRFEDLDEEDRESIMEICRKGLESGYVKKTIRKQIRKILDKKDYVEQARVRAEKAEASGKKMETAEPKKGKGKKPAQKKKEPAGKKTKTGKKAKEPMVKGVPKEAKGGKSEKKAPGKGKAEKGKKKQTILTDAILEFLPQKPEPFNLKTLKKKDEEKVFSIYQDGVDAKMVKKTIRKRIRAYLDEHDYLEPKTGKKGEKGTTPKKGGRGASKKKGEKGAIPKKEVKKAGKKTAPPKKPEPAEKKEIPKKKKKKTAPLKKPAEKKKAPVVKKAAEPKKGKKSSSPEKKKVAKKAATVKAGGTDKKTSPKKKTTIPKKTSPAKKTTGKSTAVKGSKPKKKAEPEKKKEAPKKKAGLKKKTTPKKPVPKRKAAPGKKGSSGKKAKKEEKGSKK